MKTLLFCVVLVGLVVSNVASTDKTEKEDKLVELIEALKIATEDELVEGETKADEKEAMNDLDTDGDSGYSVQLDVVDDHSDSGSYPAVQLDDTENIDDLEDAMKRGFLDSFRNLWQTIKKKYCKKEGSKCWPGTFCCSGLKCGRHGKKLQITGVCEPKSCSKVASSCGGSGRGSCCHGLSCNGWLSKKCELNECIKAGGRCGLLRLKRKHCCGGLKCTGKYFWKKTCTK